MPDNVPAISGDKSTTSEGLVTYIVDEHNQWGLFCHHRHRHRLSFFQKFHSIHFPRLPEQSKAWPSNAFS